MMILMMLIAAAGVTTTTTGVVVRVRPTAPRVPNKVVVVVDIIPPGRIILRRSVVGGVLRRGVPPAAQVRRHVASHVCYYFCGLWFFFDDLTMKFFGLSLSLFIFFAFFSSQTPTKRVLEHTAEEESQKREREKTSLRIKKERTLRINKYTSRREKCRKKADNRAGTNSFTRIF